MEVLLITSRETRRWVIPKGWPMAGKSGAASAAQEAYEEAGILGEVSPLSIGAFTYDKVAKSGLATRLTVFVFPMEVTELLDEWPERGQRARDWFSLEDAAPRVNEPELQTMIAGFRP